MSEGKVSFNEIPKRDAFPAIRGFVYQVHLTILQWFRLRHGQILELEKGEDFDVITKEIEEQKEIRELGQVKFLERGISLNQRKILDIVFNYFEHKRNNPGHNLVFRFLSNTNCVIESPSLFLDTTKGIEAWEILRTQGEIDNTNTYYQGIKRHLKESASHIIDKLDEKGFESTGWREFLQSLESDEFVQDLIGGFAWSLKTGDVNQVEQLIRFEIRKLINETNEDREKRILSKAFFHVFKVLCQPNLKVLQKNDLDTLIADESLTDDDSDLKTYLITLQNEVLHKLSDLEAMVLANSKSIADISKRSLELENNSSVMSFDYTYAISIDPPRPMENGSRRKKKVDHIIEAFQTYRWINLNGINGTGKTQLAALVCHEFEEAYWLDLRSLWNHHEHARLIFIKFIELISLSSFEHDRAEWLKRVIGGIKANALIVINDVPNPNGQNLLIEILLMLVHELHSGIRVLTTSNHSFDTIRNEKLKDMYLMEFTQLDFEDDEIEEYLLKNGAPEGIRKYISFLSTITKGNPRLVSEVLRFLKRKKWGLNSKKTLEELLQGKFSSELALDTQFAIKELIPDPESRELLYRLSFIDWSFDNSYVMALAHVDKEIEYSFEKFNELINIWIQRTSFGEYQTSPLIRKLGEQNLAPTTQREIHLAIAKNILRSESLNQISVSRLISAFIAAQDFIQAGLVLINLYQAGHNLDEIKILKEWGFLNFWNKTPMPASLPIQLQAQILHEQIRLKARLGEDSEETYNRLENLLVQESIAHDDEWIIRALCMNARPYSKMVKLIDHLNYLVTYRNHPLYSDFLSEQIIEGFVWLASTSINDKEDLFQWFELIRIAESEFPIDVFSRESAQNGITVLVNKIVDSESFLMNHDDKDSYIDVLEKFSQIFRKRSNEVLEAVIQKEIIAFVFRVEDDEEKAIRIGKLLIEQFNNDVSKYLVYEVLGKLLYNHGKKKESITWLDSAIELDCENQLSFVETLTYLACAVSRSDPKYAIPYLSRAVDLAKEKEFVLDRIQVTGEYGLSLWLVGENLSSYLTFASVISDLHALKDSHSHDRNWIRFNSVLND